MNSLMITLRNEKFGEATACGAMASDRRSVDPLLVGWRHTLGEEDHPCIVGDVKPRVEIEIDSVDLPRRRGREIDDGRPDLLGRDDIPQPGREIGEAVS